MCSDFQFSLCVATFSLNLDSDCELFSFVFVYNRHFLVLFWAVNCMVCALTSSTIKAFRFMCLCLSMTFRSGPHSSFWLLILCVNLILFLILPLCGYFYLYIVASFHLKFVRFTSLWMQLISRKNPGMIFLRAGCFGRETTIFAFKHRKKDRGRW